LRIIEEGDLGAGDDVELIRRDSGGVTVRALLGLTDLDEWDPHLAARAAEIDALPPNWRQDVLALLHNWSDRNSRLGCSNGMHLRSDVRMIRSPIGWERMRFVLRSCETRNCYATPERFQKSFPDSM
jgi:hypothetical protein